MKIGIVKESLSIGGNERSVSNISQLLSLNNEVYTILFNGEKIEYKYGGQLIDLNASPRKGILGKITNSFIRYKRLKEAIEINKIDIIYAFTSITSFWMYKRFENCKKIISCRDFGKLRKNIYLYKYVLNKSDAMIFNSKYQMEYYLARFPKDEKKCFVSYNIINIDEISSQISNKTDDEFDSFIKEHKFNIVAVGRFCKVKGFEFLIRAVSKVCEKYDTGLILIGDGELRNNYYELINNLNIKENVFFTGFKQNPYNYMSKCDLFVLSSITEGFPNVILEALACELPIVSTNCLTGPAEILGDDGYVEVLGDTFKVSEYGILTSEIVDDDYRTNKFAILSLKNAIEYMIENPVERMRFIEKTRKRLERFKKEKVLSELCSFLSYITMK